MHELGIVQGLVEAVSERVGAQARVTEVHLRVGRLSGVLPDAMRFCFDVVAAGTPLEGARLDIEEPDGLARCRACGAEFDVPGYGDVDELLAEVDAVAFSLPPHVQAPLAVRAAEAGKHFWIEKPVGRSADETADVATAAAKAGVVTSIGYNYRHVPAVEHVGQRVDRHRALAEHQPQRGGAVLQVGGDRLLGGGDVGVGVPRADVPAGGHVARPGARAAAAHTAPPPRAAAAAQAPRRAHARAAQRRSRRGVRRRGAARRANGEAGGSQGP